MNMKNEDLKDQFYSESNIKAIKESIKQLEEGKVVKKSLKKLEQMSDK
mgnify:FL=1